MDRSSKGRILHQTAARWALQLLGRLTRMLKRPSGIRKAIKRRMPGVVHVGVRAVSRRRAIRGVTCFAKSYRKSVSRCDDLVMELKAREIFKGKPWIAPIIDHGDNWLALPLYSRELLLDNLVRKIDSNMRFKIACKAASILFEIFMQGYAHRDFHSGNLFWIDDQLVVVDFEKLAPYPRRFRPAFPVSYDLVGSGLANPFSVSSPMYYEASTSDKALRRVLDVPLKDILVFMEAEFKRRLLDACGTFRSCHGHSCKRRFRYPEPRIYGSFRLPYFAVDPSETQRNSDLRLTNFGITDGIVRDKSILDLGCNTGGILFETQKYSPSQCVGIEYDAEKVRLSNEIAAFNGLNNLSFRQADIDRVDPCAIGGPFDVVFCLAVEAHVRDKSHLYDLLGTVTSGTLYFEGNSSTVKTETCSRLLASGFKKVEFLGLSNDEVNNRNNCRPLFVATK